ncbi:MAG: dephospho-CoA kinase [Rhodobacteraceae bacterium]|nr:dephospho-CoA kinase [Paracoccaceae bacterium]
MKSSKPFILGLTGSIGMGKSTTAKLFSAENVPVWDADATVHDLYQGDTPAVHAIAKLVPEAVKNQQVDRGTLKLYIAERPELLQEIEALVHPLVSQSREDFLTAAIESGVPLVVIDHPLLFETKGDQLCDAVLVVTASPQEQKRRVMERGEMSEETFEFILAKQMPDVQKRQRADYVLETTTPAAAQEFVLQLIAKISGKTPDA